MKDRSQLFLNTTGSVSKKNFKYVLYLVKLVYMVRELCEPCQKKRCILLQGIRC